MLCYLCEGSGQLFRPSGRAITSLPEDNTTQLSRQSQSSADSTSLNEWGCLHPMLRWWLIWLNGNIIGQVIYIAMLCIVMVNSMAEGKALKKRRLILHSAAEHYTTEGQECAILDICLCLDQYLGYCSWRSRCNHWYKIYQACSTISMASILPFTFIACVYVVLIYFVLC